MGWNPANWQITDSFQGQKGGINPLKAVVKYTNPAVFVADTVKDYAGNPFQGSTIDNSRNTGYQTTGSRTGGNDGSATTNTSTYGGGGGSFDPASVLEAQNAIDQANQLLGSFGGKRDAYISNLESTFGNYRAGLDKDFNRNKSQYGQTRTQTISDQEAAKQRIDSQVRSRANGLTRLLGAAGAGDSQAALELAPYAAARTGTKMRAEVNQNYGRNLQGLDQSFGQYETDYNDSVKQLADQKENQRRKFEADLLQQEYGARDALSKGQAALRYAQGGDSASARALREQALPQLYQILQQIDALSKQQVTPTVQDATYDAPDLAQYTTENVGDVGGVDPNQAEDINPYYQWLLKQREQDQQFLGY